jgi:hypothetical protein
LNINVHSPTRPKVGLQCKHLWGGKFVQKGSLMPYLEHEKNVHLKSFPQAFVKKQPKHVRVSLCALLAPLDEVIQNTIEGI